MLHISKVAVGCASLDALARRQQARVASGVCTIRTRFRPKRADELIGGSIFWIVRHRFVARQAILAFDRDEAEGKVLIRLDPGLVPVRATPRRAHQGWRYLEGPETPADANGDEDGLLLLPPRLAGRLASLALI